MSKPTIRALFVICALWVSPMPAQKLWRDQRRRYRFQRSGNRRRGRHREQSGHQPGSSAVTNRTGNYSVPYLVPGIYDIRVETPGFKAATRKE